MSDIQSVNESEITDKQARNTALRLWLQTRAELISRLMKRAKQRRCVNKKITIKRLIRPHDSEPVVVKPNIAACVFLSWNYRSTYGEIFPSALRRGKGDATIFLYLHSKQKYPPFICNADSLAQFLDTYCKDTFIHEVIHYADFRQYKGWGTSDQQDDKMDALRLAGASRRDLFRAYINSPHESNAFYHECVVMYLSALRRRELTFPKSLTEMLQQFVSTKFNSGTTTGELMASLDDVYRRKWLRRLAVLYTTRFEKRRSIG